VKETGAPKPRSREPKPPSKSKRSLKQRQVASDNAKKLVAEGRFGGKYAQSFVDYDKRRKPKHVPRSDHLVAVLREVEHVRLRGQRGPLCRLVEFLPDEVDGVDRARGSEAVCDALQEALDAKTVPRRAIVGPRNRRPVLAWKSRLRPMVYGEKLLALHDPMPDDFLGYPPRDLLQLAALLGDSMVHHGAAAARAGEFVRDALLPGLAARVDELLAEREDAA
jgi:hypothetical protein